MLKQRGHDIKTRQCGIEFNAQIAYAWSQVASNGVTVDIDAEGGVTVTNSGGLESAEFATIVSGLGAILGLDGVQDQTTATFTYNGTVSGNVAVV